MNASSILRILLFRSRQNERGCCEVFEALAIMIGPVKASVSSLWIARQGPKWFSFASLTVYCVNLEMKFSWIPKSYEYLNYIANPPTHSNSPWMTLDESHYRIKVLT